MNKVIITGADRVVGANMAAVLADRFHVTAVSPVRTTIAGCQNLTCRVDETLAAQNLLATIQPDAIVHCGELAESAWQKTLSPSSEKQTVRNVCAAAAEVDARVILVSSDQVYRGPWTFHAEDSDCLATTPAAKLAIACENRVLESDSSLVLRTHVLGWQPDGNGFLELLLSGLEHGNEFGFGHSATPLSATRFASVVASGIQQNLTGVYNVAGGERCTPFSLAAAMASHFELPQPIAMPADTSYETSMRAAKIRSALFTALPTLRETVEELFEERTQREVAFAGTTTLKAAA